MTRLNLLLLLALVLSGLYLVKTSYESRRLFTAIDGAQTEARQLEADLQREQAERQTAGTTLRVEKVARDKLGMAMPKPDRIIPVVDRAASGVAS
jgi:cell division protein FtsL